MLTRVNGRDGWRWRVTTRCCDLGLRDGLGQLVVEDLRRLANAERGQDLPLARRRRRAFRDPALVGLEGDEVHAVELVAEVAPRVAGGVLRDADEQEREPAQLDMGADAVLAVVKDGTERERSLQVPPSPLDLGELLVGEGEVGRRERVVVGAEHELAVVAGLVGDRRAVDAELALGRATKEAVEAGGRSQLADELVASLLAPGVAALDPPLQVRDEVLAHSPVARGHLRVVADDEAAHPRPLADADLLHLQVAVDTVVATGAATARF